jgi:hypothetical protein
VVDYCRSSGQAHWDRRVHLKVYNQMFCSDGSKVEVHDSNCQHLVETGQIGLGQLFRFLDIFPKFKLTKAGLTPEGDVGKATHSVVRMLRVTSPKPLYQELSRYNHNKKNKRLDSRCSSSLVFDHNFIKTDNVLYVV